MEAGTVIGIFIVIGFLVAGYIALDNRGNKNRRPPVVIPEPFPAVTPVHMTNGIVIGPKAYRSNTNDDFNATATTIYVEGSAVTYIDDLTGERKTEIISDFLAKFYLSDWAERETQPRDGGRPTDPRPRHDREFLP